MTIFTFIEDLLTELQDKGYGTKTVDLFAGPLDLSAINCIAITPYDGTNPKSIKFDENPHNPFLQVEIRNQNHKLAYTNALNIYNMWRLLTNIQIGATKFEYIISRGFVRPLGIDKSGCMSYSVNFSLSIL